MDGIDISLVKTNGIELERFNENYFYEYSKKSKKFLTEILDKDLKFNLKRKDKLDQFITKEHYQALKDLKIIKSCEFLGFHGQTIYHNPEDKISIQLGNPKQLAKLLNKPVIHDFRSKDIKFGGQGAPLAPIYHQFLMKYFKLKLPSCIINIGGVSNLTYWDGMKLIGFDTGPGNALMDNYMTRISNKHFDNNGFLASKGTPNNSVIEKFLLHGFFNKLPPKSLDRNYFINFYNNLLKNKFSESDMMATLLWLTVESIAKSLTLLPRTVNSILITGGGYRNSHLIDCLRAKLKLNIISEEDIGVKFDYIESELVAYLSARSIYNLPLTFPSTTGVCKPLSGGQLFR